MSDGYEVYSQAAQTPRLVHLFSETVAGANLHSLLRTCKVNGVDSYRYLKALFVALPLHT